MRIKQKELKDKYPFNIYKRTILGYNVTVELYIHPYMVNIIKEKDGKVSRTCYPLTEKQFGEYLVDNAMRYDDKRNRQLLDKLNSEYGKHDTDVDKFLMNAINEIERRNKDEN